MSRRGRKGGKTDQEQDHAVLAACRRFPIGENPRVLEQARGTAGAAVTVATERGRFFVRRRSREHVDTDNIDYEHRLLALLSHAGLPGKVTGFARIIRMTSSTARDS